MTGEMVVVYVGAVTTLVGLLWLMGQHRAGRINLIDLITDAGEDKIRRASLRKIGECVALGSSTFVIIYDTVADGTANEWVFGLYCGAWVSRTLFGMLAQAKAGAIAAAAK